MELVEEPNVPSSGVYEIVSTRIKEYIQPSKFITQETAKPQINNDSEIYMSITSISVLFTSIISMGVFRLGMLTSIIISLFVLAILVFGYNTFVKSAKYVEMMDYVA